MVGNSSFMAIAALFWIQILPNPGKELAVMSSGPDPESKEFAVAKVLFAPLFSLLITRTVAMPWSLMISQQVLLRLATEKGSSLIGLPGKEMTITLGRSMRTVPSSVVVMKMRWRTLWAGMSSTLESHFSLDFLKTLWSCASAATGSYLTREILGTL